MGMQSFDKKGIPVRKGDVSIAKNYLQEDEIKLLGLLVEQYLAFAETMAQQRTPMYMQDWIQRWMPSFSSMVGNCLPMPERSAINWLWINQRRNMKNIKRYRISSSMKKACRNWSRI